MNLNIPLQPTTERDIYLPNFQKRGGLITVIAQDARTKAILMLASTDEAGFRETVATGQAVYWSTSRKKRWKKGEEESGALQIVRDITIDCDGDAVIYSIEQLGIGACHTNAQSCFFRTCLDPTAPLPLSSEGKLLCISKDEQLQIVRANVAVSLSNVLTR